MNIFSSQKSLYKCSRKSKSSQNKLPRRKKKKKKISKDI